MEPASHSDINGNESSKDSPASPLAADAAAALSFLEMLYATQHAGVLATAGFPGPRTEFFDLSQPAPLERAAEYGISLAASRDVYFGVGIHGQRPAQGRGKAEGVIAIPGLWTDLDILHPVHAETKLPPDEEAALEILSEFGTPPTVTVRSGHGLQLHWLFTEPWQRDDDEWTKRAHQHAIRLQEVLRTISGTRGFRLDATADLARILRLPGTLNHKDPEDVKLVTFEATGPRYVVRDLWDRIQSAQARLVQPRVSSPSGFAGFDGFEPPPTPGKTAPPHGFDGFEGFVRDHTSEKQGDGGFPPAEWEPVLAGCRSTAATTPRRSTNRTGMPRCGSSAAAAVDGRSRTRSPPRTPSTRQRKPKGSWNMR